MRNLGGILLLLGILGFFYASSQLSDREPSPQDASMRATLEDPTARWEMVRYGCAAAGVLGLIMALFPRGR
jgi:hypothetical protein